MQNPEQSHRRRTPQDLHDLQELGSSELISELSVTVEELDVAEEELRTQNDELQRAQATLIGERERYREMFERAPVAYLVTDKNGTIADANQAAERLLACDGDRLLGKPLAVFTQDASRRRVRKIVATLADSGEMVSTSFNVLTRASRVRRVEAIVSVERDLRGRATGMRWLLIDRTRRLKREREQRARAQELEALVSERTAQLEHAQRLKDQLIATVSHEFRTALSAIGGYAELLEMGVHGELSEAQAKDVRRIHSAYSHLARVVNDLLSYSTLVTGRMNIEIGDVILADVMRGIADLVEPAARAKGLTIDIECVDSRLVARADAERVKQIVLNLLGNAVKFTPRGGHLRVECSGDQETVRVAVSDTGIGIPGNSIDQVFLPFVRLRNSAGEVGTGLGLAISRDLARAMNGDLAVTSTLGEGSNFVLSLPRSTRIATSDSHG